MRTRGFPQGSPIVPNQRISYWVEGEVDEWIMQQMEAGRMSKPPKRGNKPVVKHTRVSRKQREAAAAAAETVDALVPEEEDEGTV
jgi:hypothetical protein